MLREKLYTVIRAVLELPEDFELHDNLEPGDVPGWDSLAWINILNAIEEALNFKLPLEQVADIQNIGGFLELIREQITE